MTTGEMGGEILEERRLVERFQRRVEDKRRVTAGEMGGEISEESRREGRRSEERSI